MGLPRGHHLVLERLLCTLACPKCSFSGRCGWSQRQTTELTHGLGRWWPNYFTFLMCYMTIIKYDHRSLGDPRPSICQPLYFSYLQPASDAELLSLFPFPRQPRCVSAPQVLARSTVVANAETRVDSHTTEPLIDHASPKPCHGFLKRAPVCHQSWSSRKLIVARGSLWKLTVAFGVEAWSSRKLIVGH